MKTFILFFGLSFLLSCSIPYPKRSTGSALEITEINPNQRTALTKHNMLNLIKDYNLEPFLYTKIINIQSRVIPHSHPILTLNTRTAEFPEKILSSWLHEEFHWWEEMNQVNSKKAIADFKMMYPVLPQTGGAKDEYSTYLHLSVCFLEFKALSHFLGEKSAREILKETAEVDHIYTWIYTQILEKTTDIEAVVIKNNLLPPELK
ncbi:MAG: hypothetical protein ACOYL6_18830 [Bacteriovoracaceae bacterium]